MTVRQLEPILGIGTETDQHSLCILGSVRWLHRKLVMSFDLYATKGSNDHEGTGLNCA